MVLCCPTAFEEAGGDELVSKQWRVRTPSSNRRYFHLANTLILTASDRRTSCRLVRDDLVQTRRSC